MPMSMRSRTSKERSPGPLGVKGERTRNRIVQAGRTVFGRNGYHNTRMSDIARLANLSQGALYRYFRNKDDVFRAVLRELEEDVFSAARARIAFHEDPREALYSSNYHYLESYWNNRDTYRVFREVAAYDLTYQEIWERIRTRFRQRFLHVLSDRFGVEITRDLELRTLAVQCAVEEFAYVNFAEQLGPDLEPPVTIDEAARVTADVWYDTFSSYLAKRAAAEPESAPIE